MGSNFQLRGVVPAIVTPFTEDGEVDIDRLRRLVRFLLDGGVHGIMTNGGNGEFPLLTAGERFSITEAVASETGGAIPVIAGTGACSTREAIALAADAKRAGADAVIMTPPFYYPLPARVILDFFTSVAKAIDLPLLVYNNPRYTGNDITPAMVAELAASHVIAGVKQSDSDLGKLVDMICRTEGHLSVFTGIDSQFVSSLAVGAAGIFSTAAVALPKDMVGIFDAVLSGDLSTAASRQMRLQPLNRFMEYDPGYVAPCKELLRIQGLDTGLLREPMPVLTDEERRDLGRAWEDYANRGSEEAA